MSRMTEWLRSTKPTRTRLTPRGIERLNKLADLLETVPREQLQMGYWASFNQFVLEKSRGRIVLNSRLKRGQKDRLRLQREHACGTTACALGWAASDPWFRKRGLTWDKKVAVPVFKVKGETKGSGFSAARQFFGISHYEASWLFDRKDGHETPKAVARNIRKFVKQGS